MRLSIIIPGYNTSAAVWRRCVSSVLSACGPDDEVICLDDGSAIPFGGQEIVDSGEKRVKLVRLEKNGGQAQARNIGLEMATGRFVTFVDSDDEVLPGIYGKSLPAMEVTGGDFIVFGVKTVW